MPPYIRKAAPATRSSAGCCDDVSPVMPCNVAVCATRGYRRHARGRTPQREIYVASKVTTSIPPSVIVPIPAKIRKERRSDTEAAPGTQRDTIVPQERRFLAVAVNNPAFLLFFSNGDVIDLLTNGNRYCDNETLTFKTMIISIRIAHS